MIRDKRLIVLGLVLAGILMIAGCGDGDTEEADTGTVASQSDTTSAETEPAQTDAIPVVNATLAKTGWALVQEKCVVCHAITTVDEARLDWAGWEDAVNHMLDNGALLTDPEKEAVLEYLGTREQVKVYGASEVQQECMVCHTTERVNAAVLDWGGWEAAVDHMVENGAQIDDTQKAVIIEYLATRGPQG